MAINSVSRHRTPRHPGPDLLRHADEDLIERVHEGDARAFEVIFDRHADALFSLAYRMCGRRAIAEDVVQEALLSVWRSGGRYDRARGSVRSWLLAVVHNRAIDAFRHEVTRTSRDVSDDGIAEWMPARSELRSKWSVATRRCTPIAPSANYPQTSVR